MPQLINEFFKHFLSFIVCIFNLTESFFKIDFLPNNLTYFVGPYSILCQPFAIEQRFECGFYLIPFKLNNRIVTKSQSNLLFEIGVHF